MQEERKIDRRTPIVEPQDIQQRQAREGAPLYTEDHSEAPSHPTLTRDADLNNLACTAILPNGKTYVHCKAKSGAKGKN